MSRARVASLVLRDFRNFGRLTLDVPESGLVLVGENGAGKTNLLESLYYLSLLRSFRGAHDVDVTGFGADGFFIEAAIHVHESHEYSVGFEKAGRRKRARRDGAVLERLSDALGALPAVMFSPTDVVLVSGAPSARRRFLDIMLALSSRGYLHSLQQYRAALEQRNSALRANTRGGLRHQSTIEAFEPALAEHGARLWSARRDWVTSVSERFSRRCSAIGERGCAELRYTSSVTGTGDVAAALASALAERRAHDMKFGSTHTGPHRDDLSLLLDGRELRLFGSAGQQRSAAIVLRTLEAETLRESRDAAPVFLLDDPFAELDEGRAERVLSLLGEIGLGQSILAVPRDSDIPPELTSLERRRVVGGRLHASA
ncbi:MAG TPA: DNA replication and repair protein RecF [Gemmatimonadaceae bacterium]